MFRRIVFGIDIISELRVGLRYSFTADIPVDQRLRCGSNGARLVHLAPDGDIHPTRHPESAQFSLIGLADLLQEVDAWIMKKPDLGPSQSGAALDRQWLAG